MVADDMSWPERDLAQVAREGRKNVVAGIVGIPVVMVAFVLVPSGSHIKPVIPFLALYPALLIYLGRRAINEKPVRVATRPYVLPAATGAGSAIRQSGELHAFGLRQVKFRWLRSVVVALVVITPATVIGGVMLGAAGVMLGIAVGACFVGRAAYISLHDVALEVRVASGAIEWRAAMRSRRVPLASLRHIACSPSYSGMVELGLEGRPPLIVPVIGGFADFLDALTVACPSVPLGQDVIDRYGAWSTKWNGFFVDPSSPVTAA